MAWKIKFTYERGVTTTVTNKTRKMNLELAKKYYEMFGVHSDGGFYQESPYKEYEPEPMKHLISRLEELTL